MGEGPGNHSPEISLLEPPRPNACCGQLGDHKVGVEVVLGPPHSHSDIGQHV